MEDKRPSYYAVIPANVRYSKVSASAKLLYGEITALAEKDGYCWATNDYFAKLYNVGHQSISRWIKELDDEDFIESVLSHAEKGHAVVRKIYIGTHKNVGGVPTKMRGGTHKNATDSNTISNTTIEKTKAKKTQEVLEQVIQIVNPKEKPTSDRLRTLAARLKDYTEADLLAAATQLSQSRWHRENKQMSVDNLLAPSKFGRWYAQAQEAASAPGGGYA